MKEDRWQLLHPGKVLSEEDPLAQRPSLKDAETGRVALFPGASVEAARAYTDYLNDVGFPEG